MALVETGLRLIADGAQAYTDALQRAHEAQQKVNSSGKEAANGLGAIRDIMLGTFLGKQLDAAFNKVTNFFVSFPNMALESIKAIQDLELSLESLIAKEYINSGAAADMNEALTMTAYPVDELMVKIKELSIASPFEYKDVVGTLQMSMAFGQTAETAVQLTEAITNIGSVNKSIPGILQRLTYNFSQMNMVGKVSGRDIKDLAMIGLDLNKVIKDNLNMSVEELNSKLATGEMTMDAVNQAFIEFAKANYGGAAERAARTLGGLASTFNDIFFFLASDLFKPVVDRLTIALGSLLDMFMDFIGSGALQIVGAGFDVIAEEALKVISSLRGVGTTLYEVNEDGQEVVAGMIYPLDIQLNRLGTKISTKIQEAFSWGAELVSNFAAGIVEGAATVLSASMDVIGNMLSWFLMPGSPPRVVPDIDKWGTATMAEYLHGFEEADFGALKGITKPIQDVLTAVMPEKTDAMGTYVRLSKELAVALSTGADVSEEFYKVLATSAGEYGTELTALVTMQLAQKAALDKATASAEAFAKAQEEYSKADEVVNKQIDEYNKMLAEGATKEQLDAKRKEIAEAKKGRKAAVDNIKTAAKTAQADQEAAEALQKKIALQEQVINQLMEFKKAQDAATKAAEKAADKADKAAGKEKAGGKGGGTPSERETPKLPVPTLGAIGKQATEEFEGLRNKFKEGVGTLFKPFTDAYDTKLKPMIDALALKWEWFTDILGRLWNQTVVPIIDGIKKLIPQEFLDKVAKAAGFAWTLVKSVLGVKAVFAGLGVVLKMVIIPALASLFVALTSPVSLAIGAITLLKLAWDENFLGMRDAGLALWAKIQPVLQAINLWLQTYIPLALQATVKFISGTLLPAIGDIYNWWKTKWLPPFVSIYEWLKVNIPLAIQAVAAWWTGTLVPALKIVWEWVQTKLVPALAGIWKWLATNIPLAIATVVAWWKKNFLPMWESLYTWLKINIPAAVKAVVSWWNTKLLPAFRAVANWITTVFIPAVTRIYEWLKVNIPLAIQAVVTWWNNLKTSIKTVSDWFTGTLIPFFVNLYNWLFVKLPAALVKVGTEFINRLLAPIKVVWGWIQEYLIPLFAAIAHVIDAVLGYALRVLVAFWENILLPAFQAAYDYTFKPIGEWFQNIFTNAISWAQAALAGLISFWTTILKPAFEWVYTNIFQPIGAWFQDVFTWAVSVAKSVAEGFVEFWDTVLKPAIDWVYLNIFIPLATFLREQFAIAFGTVHESAETLSTFWTGTLQPALENFWNKVLVPLYDFINNSFLYVLGLLYTVGQNIGKYWNETLSPAISKFYEETIKPLGDYLGDTFIGFLDSVKGAFEGIGDKVEKVIGFFEDLATGIETLELPDWLTPGSPTPFETAMSGLATVLSTNLYMGIQAVSGIMQSTLLLAINAINTAITVGLSTAFTNLVTLITTVITPTMVGFGTSVTTVATAFGEVIDSIERFATSMYTSKDSLTGKGGMIEAIGQLVDTFAGMKTAIYTVFIPMMGDMALAVNSPTTIMLNNTIPAINTLRDKVVSIRDAYAGWEAEIRDVIKALEDLNRVPTNPNAPKSKSKDLPANLTTPTTVQHPASNSQIASQASTTTTTTQYILNAEVKQTLPDVQRGFAIMEVMA